MKINSSSAIAIVTPKCATPREIFAAEELKKYLKMIFPGLHTCICNDEDEIIDDKILIGGPERNKLTAVYISEADFDAIVPGPEGIYIKAFGSDTLIVAGSSKNVNENERGTLYAVYELLERYFGCSFSAYVNPEIAGGEHIPVMQEIDLTGISYIKAAADNIYRTAIEEIHRRKVDHPLNWAFVDWLAKNRYNRILTWTYAYEQMKACGIVAEAERRGLLFTVGHHDAIPTFLPPHGNQYFAEEYHKTHPEFYKLMEDGSRFEIGVTPERGPTFGSWILCSRNPELPKVIADNIIRWIEMNPNVDTIAFWPMDGKSPQCLCPECSKYSKVENYTHVLNSVAKQIGLVYPHIKIDMLTYVDLWEYPEGAVLEPNLVIDEAVWHHTGLRTIGKPDGSCLAGTFFEEDLLKWHKAGTPVVYYDYFMGVQSARQRYMPAADEMQSMWKRFVEVGISGSGTQIEYCNFWNHIFNFYCFARTGYDTELSLEKNLQAFTRIFGEGAPYIAEVIRIAEACLDGQVPIKLGGLYLMEHIDKEACYTLFDKAFAASTTAAARNNIRMMRMVFRYSDVECKYTKQRGQEGQVYTPYETCCDPEGELYYMSQNYDSSKWADPGYGIMIPVDETKLADFVPDHWYAFEK